MAKPGPKSGAGRRRSDETRRRIVEAAVEVLKREGFAGASAVAVAAEGRVSQGLIFYHFGTVPDLLLAALDETSSRRMEEYRAAVAGIRDLPGLLEVAARVYREDLASGHIKVLAEMIAGASTVPGLGPKIVQRIEPWVRFTEDTLRAVVSGTPLEPFLPLHEAAQGVVALYLGVELLAHLDGEQGTAEGLFDAGSRLMSLMVPLLGVASRGGG